MNSAIMTVEAKRSLAPRNVLSLLRTQESYWAALNLEKREACIDRKTCRKICTYTAYDPAGPLREKWDTDIFPDIRQKLHQERATIFKAAKTEVPYLIRLFMIERQAELWPHFAAICIVKEVAEAIIKIIKRFIKDQNLGFKYLTFKTLLLPNGSRTWPTHTSGSQVYFKSFLSSFQAASTIGGSLSINGWNFGLTSAHPLCHSSDIADAHSAQPDELSFISDSEEEDDNDSFESASSLCESTVETSQSRMPNSRDIVWKVTALTRSPLMSLDSFKSILPSRRSLVCIAIVPESIFDGSSMSAVAYFLSGEEAALAYVQLACELDVDADRIFSPSLDCRTYTDFALELEYYIWARHSDFRWPQRLSTSWLPSKLSQSDLEGDWLLIPLDLGEFDDTSTEAIQINNIEYVVTGCGFGKVSDQEATMYCGTSGPCRVKVSTSTLGLYLPSAERIVEVYSCDKRTAAGDSGSWVVGDGGLVIGSVLATCAESFVIPMSNTIQSIQALDPNVRISFLPKQSLKWCPSAPMLSTSDAKTSPSTEDEIRRTNVIRYKATVMTSEDSRFVTEAICRIAADERLPQRLAFDSLLDSVLDSNYQALAQTLLGARTKRWNNDAPYFDICLIHAAANGSEGAVNMLLAIKKTAEEYHLDSLQLLDHVRAGTDAQWLAEIKLGKEPWAGSALRAASAGGHLSTAQLLLEAGSNVNATHGPYDDVLEYVFENNCSHRFREIIEVHPGIIVRGYEFGTALQVATRYGHEEVTMLLLHAGADPNLNDNFRRSPLYIASHRGHHDLVHLLLDAGANPNSEDSLHSPIHAASYHGHARIVKTLINAGADVMATGPNGYDALHCAEYMGKSEVVDVLLEAGATFGSEKVSGQVAAITFDDEEHGNDLGTLTTEFDNELGSKEKSTSQDKMSAYHDNHKESAEVAAKEFVFDHGDTTGGISAFRIASFEKLPDYLEIPREIVARMGVRKRVAEPDTSKLAKRTAKSTSGTRMHVRRYSYESGLNTENMPEEPMISEDEPIILEDDSMTDIARDARLDDLMDDPMHLDSRTGKEDKRMQGMSS